MEHLKKNEKEVSLKSKLSVWELISHIDDTRKLWVGTGSQNEGAAITNLYINGKSYEQSTNEC